jgi:nitrite reductase/ring-hydroxylating ferredoxin subunit
MLAMSPGSMATPPPANGALIRPLTAENRHLSRHSMPPQCRHRLIVTTLPLLRHGPRLAWHMLNCAEAKPTYPEEAVTEADKVIILAGRECRPQLSRRRDNVEVLAVADSWCARVHALQPGQTASFQLQCGSEHVPGFIVNHRGCHYAYVNRCRHERRPLDWRHKFLTDDGLYLICAVHSALFEQETGTCIEGPCRGAWLEPLRIERDGDWLVVTRPDSAR